MVKRKGCSIIGAARASRGKQDDNDDNSDSGDGGDSGDDIKYEDLAGDGEEELGEVIDFTLDNSDEEDASVGTRQWLIENARSVRR